MQEWGEAFISLRTWLDGLVSVTGLRAFVVD
jgi:hypothetical protein